MGAQGPMNVGFERVKGAAIKRFGKPDAALSEFFDWYWAEGPALFQAPMDGASFVGNGPGLVIFREAPFQVQLFICNPDSVIPEHTHPTVESYEVHVSGDVEFFVAGQQTHPTEALQRTRRDSNVQRAWGYRQHVPPGAPHHAVIGSKGGAFVSVQKWPAGAEPTSIDEDWDGTVMDATHMAALSARTAAEINALCGDDEVGLDPYVLGKLCD